MNIKIDISIFKKGGVSIVLEIAFIDITGFVFPYIVVLGGANDDGDFFVGGSAFTHHIVKVIGLGHNQFSSFCKAKKTATIESAHLIFNPFLEKAFLSLSLLLSFKRFKNKDLNKRFHKRSSRISSNSNPLINNSNKN